MSTDLKLPHHLSAVYKTMKAEGLINDQKEYVGELPLADYYKSIGYEPEETQKPNEQTVEPVTEQTVPLSMVQQMIDEALKNIPQAPAPIVQPTVIPQYYGKKEVDIDDLPEFKNWEMKDREYELCEGKPISCSIPSKHSKEIPLQYTNEETKTVHILRYSTNQPSFFVEKQSKEEGSVLLSEIIFKYGRLKVSADNITLQKFLAIHPYKNILFKEYDPKAKSVKIVNDKKLKIEAGGLVFKVGETVNRAIASIVLPSYVDSWSVELLEEEILAYAENNPEKYIAFTEDSTVKMKGVIKRALANGDLIYSNYRFLNRKRETILEVAKNQDELDEMVKHFESGIGRTTYEFLLNAQN